MARKRKKALKKKKKLVRRKQSRKRARKAKPSRMKKSRLVDRELDEGLAETFPGSDAVAMTDPTRSIKE
jgi:hypothetical protein